MSAEGLSRDLNISENRPEKISDKDIFRARNEIQIKLAARYYGFEIEDQQLEKWVDLYSKRFGEIMGEHPEFLDEYVHGETEKSVDEVAELLYEKHEVQA